MKTWIKCLACCFMAALVQSQVPVLAQNANNKPSTTKPGSPLPAPGNTGELKVYLAQDESARRVLEGLISMFGYRLVSNSLPNRPVSGRFEVRSIDEVMSYFKGTYELNYFINGIHVHVYRASDWQTERVYVGGSDRSNDDWRDMLTSAGLYYREFPSIFNRDKKELVVSGPKAYINLIKNTFGEDLPDPSEAEKYGVKLMSFPLKHASVEDRKTKVRDAEMITPGALSVLLNLLGLPAQNGQAKASGGGLGGDFAGIIGHSPEALKNADRLSSLPNTGKPDPANKSGQKSPTEQPVSVTADPRTNTILIRDAANRYDYYKSLIDQLDKPVAMIEVEALMVEVNQQTLNELGLEFGLNAGRVAYNFPGASVGRENFVTPGANSIVDPQRFIARLRALDADEDVKVLARPTIVTQDNVTAYIDLSQTLYIRLTGERVADVREVTAGSLLQVTPRVVRDEFEDRIFLRVDIQDGTIGEDINVSLPRVQNTSISTQALIEREKAVLIGGYNRNAVQEKEYKVPLLGNIPILGKAFTTSEKSNEELSRLFLIVPRLIEHRAPMHPSTQGARGVIEKNFSYRSESLQPEPSMRLDSTLSLPKP
ncbi:MAG TPA: type III secretion system outer membrane ring subunit SctC [Limnobacter sp.]|nr:type III secretion system outer membrane ring subunit SctC [Limnobacter sp.]